MPQAIPSPELRVAAAYVAVFVVSLVVTSLLGLLISKIVKAAGLGGVDRALGALFGAARGLLIVLAAVLEGFGQRPFSSAGGASPETAASANVRGTLAL